jgi:class 3 adenylate cyclase
MSLITPHSIVSLVALGMALAFLSADSRSPTSQALAVSLGTTGIAIFLNVTILADTLRVPAWSGLLAIPDAVALIAMLEWLLRVRRTIPAARELNTAFGDRILRVGQFATLCYAAASIVAPQLRVDYFLRAASTPGTLSTWQFWLFAGPIELAALTGMVAIGLLLRRRPDRMEKTRVLAMASAVPFFLAGFILPLEISAVSVAVGEIILLVGAVHYQTLQGQRGMFLSRFLSPDVARLVSERGLRSAMQENQLDISVVCCDLRGFTAYAQARPSWQVLQVLREYYDAVGRVVAEFGATIKDYAGDGILILVGAPLPAADHAVRALEMARRIRSVCAQLTPRWSEGGPRLGLGIGVASGPVTVGVIGSALHLEYTAVGNAVNLAARLCEQAIDGDILLDSGTRALLSDSALPEQMELRAAVQVKGFAEPVALYALPV